MPKAVVPEHLRHVFLKFKARQPQATMRAVALAEQQPKKPAKRPRQQQKRMLCQPQQPPQSQQQKLPDAAQNRHGRRRNAFQKGIQQGQQAVKQRGDGISLFVFRFSASRFFRHESYAFSMHATAWLEMPSPSPSKPSFSVVVALMFTQSISTLRWRATFSRICSM